LTKPRSSSRPPIDNMTTGLHSTQPEGKKLRGASPTINDYFLLTHFSKSVNQVKAAMLIPKSVI